MTDASKRVAQNDVWQVEGIANNAYGLGFGVVRVGGRRLPGHAGGYPGHITRTVFDPESRFAVSVLTNAIDGPAEPLALAVVKLLDLAARLEPDGSAASVGADRFVVRLANLWGVRDVALLGGRLVLLDPTAPDPTEGFSELAIEGHVDAAGHARIRLPRGGRDGGVLLRERRAGRDGAWAGRAHLVAPRGLPAGSARRSDSSPLHSERQPGSHTSSSVRDTPGERASRQASLP